MPADNTAQLIDSARRRHELTRAKAIRALRELDRAGIPVTFEQVARTAEVSGRGVLVGVALTEDPVMTAVPSGENAGRTLVEHHVVRRFDHKFTRVERKAAETLTFPVELPAGADPARLRVSAFVQDLRDGRVYQADAIPWSPTKAPGLTSAPR